MKKTLLILLFGISNAMAQEVNVPCSGNLNSNQLTDKAIQAAGSIANGGSANVNSLTSTVTNQITDCANQATRQWLNNLLATDRGVTEISGNFVSSNLPSWGILLVRPLTESADKKHTTFFQGSVFVQGDRTTTNYGLGYRQLVADKKVLLGVNAFFDYEFPYANQRTSIGGEIRTTVGELNVNYYQGVSGWVTASNGMLEKALGGYDAELAIALPYIPSAHVRAKAFRWFGVEGLDDVYGYQYSLTGAIGYGFGIEAGSTIYSSGQPTNNFMKLTWTIGGDRSQNQKQFKFRDTAYALESMEDRRFEKVRRENTIVKAQKASDFKITVTGF